MDKPEQFKKQNKTKQKNMMMQMLLLLSIIIASSCMQHILWLFTHWITQ